MMNTRAERPTATLRRFELRPRTGSLESKVNPVVRVVSLDAMSPIMWAGMSEVKISVSFPTKYDEYTHHDMKENGSVPQCLGDRTVQI